MGDQVGEAPGVVDVHGRDVRVFGEVGVELDTPLEKGEDDAHEGFDDHALGISLEDGDGQGPQVWALLGETDDASPVQPLDERAQRPVREAQSAPDEDLGAHFVEVLGQRSFQVRVPLRDDEDGEVLLLGVLQGPMGAFPGDEEGKGDGGKDDDVPRGEDDVFLRLAFPGFRSANGVAFFPEAGNGFEEEIVELDVLQPVAYGVFLSLHRSSCVSLYSLSFNGSFLVYVPPGWRVPPHVGGWESRSRKPSRPGPGGRSREPRSPARPRRGRWNRRCR